MLRGLLLSRFGLKTLHVQSNTHARTHTHRERDADDLDNSATSPTPTPTATSRTKDRGTRVQDDKLAQSYLGVADVFAERIRPAVVVRSVRWAE
jgi:hypothetical protein